jgi:hypothetical protein
MHCSAWVLRSSTLLSVLTVVADPRGSYCLQHGPTFRGQYSPVFNEEGAGSVYKD